MTVNERRSIYCHNLTPETRMCVNCAYYYQHYLKDGHRLCSGHCVHPRLKLRRDYDTCENFKKKEV